MRTIRVFGPALLVLAACGGLWASEPHADHRTRADAASPWDYRYSPGIAGFDDPALTLGFRLNSTDVDGGTYTELPRVGVNAVADLLIASPLLWYEVSFRNTRIYHNLGGAFGFGDTIGVGFNTSWDNADPDDNELTLGLGWRTADLLSVALVGHDLGGNAAYLGIGIGIRPLFFVPSIHDMLTLSVDARAETAGLVMENMAVRLQTPLGIGARLWLDLERDFAPSLEISLDLGASRDRARVPDLSSPGEVRVSGELRFPPNMPPLVSALAPGTYLYFDNPGYLRPVPRPAMPFVADLVRISGDTPGSRRQSDYSVDEFVAELNRASANPAIKALVIEGSFGAEASADTLLLADAIARFKAAGKQFYYYADTISDTEAYLHLYAQADRLSINPNGSLAIFDYGQQRLYLKDLLDKFGVEVVNFGVADTKSANNTLDHSAMPEAERNQLLRLQQALRDAALKRLAASRSGLRNPAETLILAPWFIASEAERAGLVDALEYHDEFETQVGKDLAGLRRAGFLPRDTGSWGRPIATKRVAVVYLKGTIGDDTGFAGQSIGRSAAEELAALRDNLLVSAVILRIDSGGGSGFTSDLIAREIRLLQEAGKPVVAVMGNYAASGGYYIAAHSTRIFAQETTLTGSIGVTGIALNISGTLEMLGINADGPALSDSNRFMDPTEPFREADIAKLRARIENFYERFLSVVAEGRNLSVDDVRAMAGGQVWTGKEALDLKLVDELGGLAEAKVYLEGRLGGVVEYTDILPGRILIPGIWNFFEMFGSTELAGESLLADLAVAGSPLVDLARDIEPFAAELRFLFDQEGNPLYLADPDLLFVR